MNKAVFIDRDGTINIDIGYAYKEEDCKLIEKGIGNILKKIRDLGYLLIITTNQAGIDKGYYNEKDFFRFMAKLEETLGITFDGIYFCPYHPNFSGKHDCRKPNNGMILKAKKDFNINLKESYIIGDNLKDIESGKKSGCQTILYNSNNFTNINSDFMVNKWSEILKIIK